VVRDATRDSRFADNALVTGAPGLRFYVGSPVYGPNNQPLGALCVMDTRAGPEVTPDKLAALKALAADVSAVFATPTRIDFKREREW
jgi:GAF domain-containing protein